MGVLNESETFYKNYEKLKIVFQEFVNEKDSYSLNKLGLFCAKMLLLKELDTFNLAENCFIEAYKLRNIDAMNNLGMLHEKMERYDLAEECYKKAMNQGNADAMNNLGILYEQIGRYDLAKKCYESAICAGNIDAMDNLEKFSEIIYELIGEDDILEVYNLANQGEIKALKKLGLLYCKKGKINLAEECYKKALIQGDIDSLNDLGIIYYWHMNMIDLAEGCFKKAINEGNIEAIGNLGRLYYDIEKYDLAEKYIKKAINNGDILAQYFWEDYCKKH